MIFGGPIKLVLRMGLLNNEHRPNYDRIQHDRLVYNDNLLLR